VSLYVLPALLRISFEPQCLSQLALTLQASHLPGINLGFCRFFYERCAVCL
jgi:hypothetical protein